MHQINNKTLHLYFELGLVISITNLKKWYQLNSHSSYSVTKLIIKTSCKSVIRDFFVSMRPKRVDLSAQILSNVAIEIMAIHIQNESPGRNVIAFLWLYFTSSQLLTLSSTESVEYT